MYYIYISCFGSNISNSIYTNIIIQLLYIYLYESLASSLCLSLASLLVSIRLHGYKCNAYSAKMFAAFLLYNVHCRIAWICVFFFHCSLHFYLTVSFTMLCCLSTSLHNAHMSNFIARELILCALGRNKFLLIFGKWTHVELILRNEKIRSEKGRRKSNFIWRNKNIEQFFFLC